MGATRSGEGWRARLSCARELPGIRGYCPRKTHAFVGSAVGYSNMRLWTTLESVGGGARAVGGIVEDLARGVVVGDDGADFESAAASCSGLQRTPHRRRRAGRLRTAPLTTLATRRPTPRAASSSRRRIEKLVESVCVGIGPEAAEEASKNCAMSTRSVLDADDAEKRVRSRVQSGTSARVVRSTKPTA